MDIALFDFDGTITIRESISCFLRYICRTKWEFYKKILPHLPYVFMYFCGLYPNWKLKQRILASFIRGMDEHEFRELAHRFGDERIDKILRPVAMERIAWHKSRGDRVVIVSAGIRDYIEPWALKNGIEDVIAVDLEVVDGKMTGNLNGLNCYGEEKARRIRSHIDLSEYGGIYAYGDTRGDKEMLAMADLAYYKFKELKH